MWSGTEINTKALSRRIHFWLKTDIFFSGLAYRPCISGKNGHRKCIFSETLSREEIFEKPAFYLHVDGWKQRFLNTMISSQHDAWSVRDVFVSRSENYSNMLLCVDAHFNSENREKSPFSKISRYRWTGPKCLFCF